MKNYCLLSGVLVLWISTFEPVTCRTRGLKCSSCEQKRCPRVMYCVGTIVKDSCGCCNVCSSDRLQPHVKHKPLTRTGACGKVLCPKNKVCLLNLQGLPLCTCPQIRSCRKRKREVCGTDNVTYHSRCYMKVHACEEGRRIRPRHRGKCFKPGKVSMIKPPVVKIKTVRRSKNGAVKTATLPLDGYTPRSSKKRDGNAARKTRKQRRKRIRKKFRGKKRRRRYRSRALKARKARRVRLPS